ncbi:transmembrane protein 132C [Denticeps clupeoides]|uniref:Transmembrane protein 132C-like n=1 Tax=Denticeps clupeoides TaxID=299321 RepID=A0AAY3ZUB0_9TELE|nr:transmembrane protein 132C-like [Denticeps clupeoides]
MSRPCTLGLILVALCRVMDSRVLLEGLQRYSPTPTYLPVRYSVLNAESVFFLKEANQDIMRNSSLQARTELFFIQQARRNPVVNASYGPLTVQQAVPIDLLGPSLFGNPSSSTSSSSAPLFTFRWKVQTFIISERIHPSWPKVQVLFYVSGRDWDDYSAVDRLPCVRMFAFHETQEVRGTCRLKGELGMCVAELEPLASWFSPPSVVPGRQRAPEQSEGTPIELYYMVQSTDSGECSSEDSRKASSVRTEPQGPMGYFSGPTPMRRIGSVRLYQPLAELRLDSTFVVMVPSRPIRQRETVSAFLAASTLSPVEIFTLRVKLKEGMVFLGAKATNPTQWTVSQDVRSEGHRVVTLHCRRKDASYGQRMEAAFQKIVQVDLEVNGLLEPLATRIVTWQVEYPLSRTTSDEIQTLIRLAPQDLGSIVPLAMDTEILNTAALTGRTVAVPVKVVTVGTDSAVTDVTESVECRSPDEDVVKVSERCDYVYVNGKETRGRVRMLVNFTYSYLSAQLEVSVWMPRLPLHIELSDSELSQIKGWRVPVTSGSQRTGSEREDEEEDRIRRERGCVPQYQSSTVRVLTHFTAEPAARGGQVDFLLGSDWQVDVTELIHDSLRVEDSTVARLLDGTVLMGLDTGTTKIQVMSPLSDSVLAERSVRVVDDKVLISELGVQLASGLSLNLQLSPGSNKAIVATATTQEVMQRPKQESLISAWLQFSDGSMTPLDLYDSAHFVLAATSLDEEVVTVRQDLTWKWPIVVAKGEGQGLLVRLEMFNAEVCQKSKRRSILASGNGYVRVRFGQGEEVDSRAGDRRHRMNTPYYGGSISDIDAGIMNRGATTMKTAMPGRPSGGRLSSDGGLDVPIDFSEFPAQAELPRGRSTEDDLLQTHRGLTDLEIGMYALLGVFCLAILVFLINCVSYALKYRNKQLPLEGQETMAHSHDWVWLGQEGELLEGPQGLCLQQEDLSSILDSGLGLEEGSQLLNGISAQKGAQGIAHRSGAEHKSESLNSPTTKRKRVKFTTFTHGKSSNGCPAISPLVSTHSSDIKWVCPDIELGDSKELRNYMERLNENATKSLA